MMRSALATVTQRRGNRSRSTSLSSVPPAKTSGEYDRGLATLAASIIYKSPLPSQAGLPIYIVNAAAFPDAYEVDYNALLPYVLARLPEEDELISGTEYEIIFFAGGQPDGATTEKSKGRALVGTFKHTKCSAAPRGRSCRSCILYTHGHGCACLSTSLELSSRQSSGGRS